MKQRRSYKLRRAGILLVALLILGSPLLLLDRGDWFPFERTARALFNGWDMWSTEAVNPHERPMPPVPAGVVPYGGLRGSEHGRQALQRLGLAARAERGKIAYRRYCHHCHGTNGDGRIIVGESFGFPLPDLRAGSAVQELDDEALYELVAGGNGRMIPLADTITPLELHLAIAHLRTLSRAPSHPFFPPRDTLPLAVKRRPGR